MTGSMRLAAGGAIDRTKPLRFTFDGETLCRASRATRWPRRCSRTASRSSAAASSITARAASIAPASEEPNAILDLRHGARHDPQLRARRSSRWPTAWSCARSTRTARRPERPARLHRPLRALHSRRPSTTRPSCGRTGRPTSIASAPWPASAARSAQPQRGRPARIFRNVDVVRGWRGAGRAWRRRSRQSSAGKSVVLAEMGDTIGGSLAVARTRSTASRRAKWAAEAAAQPRGRGGAVRAHPHDGLRSLRPQCSSSWSSVPPAPASGCGGSGRGEIVVAAGAIERPMLFANNDRPGVMLAAPR